MLKSFRALLLGEAVNKAARLAASVLLARGLSVDDFGLVNVGIAIAGIATMATTLGFSELGAREVAVQDAPGPATLASTVLTARSLSVLTLAVPALALVAVLDASLLPLASVIAAMSLCFALSLEWVLRGQERMAAFSKAMGAGGVVVLVGVALTILVTDSPVVALGVFVVGEAVTAALTWRGAGVVRAVRPRLTGARRLFSRSWPLALSSFITYAYYANLDTVLLSALRSTRDAGLYSAPYRIFLAVNVVAVFAAYVLLPVQARRQQLDQAARGPDVLLIAMVPLLGYGCLVLGVAELIGGELLSFVFGPPFGTMGTTFIILVTAVPWYSVGYPAGYGLIARDAHRRFLAGAATAGVLNILLGFALIPPLGPEGAAIATTAALAGASVVWIAQTTLGSGGGARVLAVLGVVSAGGIIAAADATAAKPVGAVTLAVGLILAWRARSLVGGRLRA